MRRPEAALLVACLLVTAPACSKKGTPAARGEGARPPVAAPEGLLGEIIVAHPEHIWETIRTDVGSGSSFVPRSAPLFIGSVLGLPAGSLDQLDLTLPVLGSLSDGATSTGIVLAIHVKDGERMADLVCEGKPARCTRKTDAASGVVVLEPEPGAELGANLGVSGNYLCVASDRGALLRFAPFVTRTLPTRPLPRESATLTVPRSALAGPIATQLKRLWGSFKKEREADDLAMRAKHGGSAPDFGDPTEALADVDTKVASLVSILGDLEEARVTLAVETVPSEVRLQIAMTPAPGNGPASQELAAMSPGGAEPLLALPSTTIFALFTRDGTEMRARSAKEQSEAIGRVLGGRLAAVDKGKIDEALHNWASGRGDWLAAGVLSGNAGRSLVVRTSVSDADKLGRGAAQLLQLLSIPAIAEPLASWIGELKVSPATGPAGSAEGPTTLHVVHRPAKVQLRKGAPRPTESDAFDIVWSVGGSGLFGAAGADAKRLHASLAEGRSGHTLEEDPGWKASVAGLGPNVSFLLVLDADQLLGGAGAATKGSRSPVVLAYGKTAAGDAQGARERGWLRLDVPSALLASYAQLLSAGAASPLDPPPR